MPKLPPNVTVVIRLLKAGQLGMFGGSASAPSPGSSGSGRVQVRAHTRKNANGTMSYVGGYSHGRGRSKPAPSAQHHPAHSSTPGRWFKLVRAADLHGKVKDAKLKTKLRLAMAGEHEHHLDHAISEAEEHLGKTAKASPPTADRDTRTIDMFEGDRGRE